MNPKEQSAKIEEELKKIYTSVGDAVGNLVVEGGKTSSLAIDELLNNAETEEEIGSFLICEGISDGFEEVTNIDDHSMNNKTEILTDLSYYDKPVVKRNANGKIDSANKSVQNIVTKEVKDKAQLNKKLAEGSGQLAEFIVEDMKPLTVETKSANSTVETVDTGIQQWEYALTVKSDFAGINGGKSVLMKSPEEKPDVKKEEKPKQNIEPKVNKNEKPKEKDDSNDTKMEESDANREHYRKFLEEDYKKQIARKEKDVRIKFEKITRLLLKFQYENLIVYREKENNGLLCPIEDFRMCPLDQHYSDRFKFYIGIDTETKEPALGFQDGYGFVKQISKRMQHSYPVHIIKTIKVLEKAVKASKMAPSTPSVKTRVWHEVIVHTNFSQELMLLVLVNCPEESSADDLKNLKNELTEFFQKGEGKQCCVVSLYMKVINTVRAQKVWGCSEDMELIMGTPFLEETFLSFKFHLSPLLEFSQNRHTVKAICNGAEEMLCPLDKMSVLLVGCSIGVYGFYMSKIAGEVLYIDTHEFIKEAQKNAKLNSITDCQFFGGNYKTSIITAAKKITCAESCAIIVITDSNQSFINNSTLIKLRQIESLKKIVLVLELSNSHFNSIYQLSIPNFNNDLCSPFFPVRAIPIDSAPITNSYTVLILMERIELANLPSFSKDKLDSRERNISFPLNPYEGNLDARASAVAGTSDNPSAAMDDHVRELLALKQRRLIEEQKILAEIEQQRSYLEEEQIQNRLVEKQRREQLTEEHQRRRFEEEQQIILFQEECQRRLVEEEHQRRRIEEEFQMRICEREQLKRNARGTYQWVSFEAEYERFLLAIEHQKKVLIEEQQNRRLEEEQRRRQLKEKLQRRLMEDIQQMRLFEEAQQRRQLEEERQIRLFEEEKKLGFKEWQRRQLEEEEFLRKKLEEEEFLRKKLKEEEFQRAQLDKEEWHRRRLEEEWHKRQLGGEWQVNKSEEQQRFNIGREWQMRQAEERHRRQLEERQKQQLENQQKIQLLKEKQQKRMLEELQKKQVEEEQKRKQVEEEQKRKQVEEEQKKKQVEEERKRKLVEEEQKKRQFMEEQQKRQLEKEQKLKQLEEEQKKRQLEEEQKKMQLEEEQKKRQLEEEQKKRKLEEEQKKRKLEEEQKKRKLEEEQKKRKLEEEQKKRKLEEEQKKRKLEEEQKKMQLEEEQKKRKLEEEQKKKQLEEEQKKRKLEEEQKKKQLEEEQKKRELEEEHIRLEKERQWKLIEEARLKKELVEEVRKQLLEEERQRRQLEEEQKRKQLEEEEKIKRLEKEKQKKKLEEERKKRELEEKRKKRELEEERKRKKRLEEEQKRKKLEDEREKRKLEEERRKRKLEEERHKREFEEKEKRPRWVEEREDVSQRSNDDAVAALVSKTLKESGVTQLSADTAEKLKQVIAEAMKSVGVLGQQNIGTRRTAEEYSQNMQRGVQQQNIRIGHAAEQFSTYSQNMWGDEQRGVQQQNIRIGHAAEQFSTYSQNMRGDEQRGIQQSNVIAANTYVRYEHLINASKRDTSNKYSSSEWQRPVTIQNRNTSDTPRSVPDWNTKSSDSRYSCGVTSIQNRNTSDTQRYVSDWNPTSSDSRYSNENSTYSQGKLNTTDSRYNYRDLYDLKQLPKTGEVSAEFKFRFEYEGYNSLNHISPNMTDDRYGYNKDRCSETPSSSMNQGISSDRFSFKDTLSQTLQDRRSKIDPYRLDSASFHSWKDTFAPLSEPQENPFRSYWNQKRDQMGPEGN